MCKKRTFYFLLICLFISILFLGTETFAQATTTPEEKTEFKIITFEKYLKLDNSGPKVKELQERLNEYGYKLEEDGIFGSRTQNAVINFQYKCNLEVDGIVGPNTIEKLNIPVNENTLFNASVPTDSDKDNKDNKDNEDNKNDTNESTNYMSADELETFINSTDENSDTQYLIWVDLPNQRVNIFKRDLDKWILDRSCLCSTGKASTPTVKGHFTIKSKGPMFRAGSNTICKYYTQFYGNYLFHTVLLDNKGNIQDGRLGTPLSHGCIRLSIENAKYIYSVIPYGTSVWIK